MAHCPFCGGNLMFESQHQMGGLPTATEYDCQKCEIEYIYHDGVFNFAQRFGLGGSVKLSEEQKKEVA